MTIAPADCAAKIGGTIQSLEQEEALENKQACQSCFWKAFIVFDLSGIFVGLEVVC